MADVTVIEAREGTELGPYKREADLPGAAWGVGVMGNCFLEFFLVFLFCFVLFGCVGSSLLQETETERGGQEIGRAHV